MWDSLKDKIVYLETWVTFAGPARWPMNCGCLTLGMNTYYIYIWCSPQHDVCKPTLHFSEWKEEIVCKNIAMLSKLVILLPLLISVVGSQDTNFIYNGFRKVQLVIFLQLHLQLVFFGGGIWLFLGVEEKYIHCERNIVFFVYKGI